MGSGEIFFGWNDAMDSSCDDHSNQSSKEELLLGWGCEDNFEDSFHEVEMYEMVEGTELVVDVDKTGSIVVAHNDELTIEGVDIKMSNQSEILEPPLAGETLATKVTKKGKKGRVRRKKDSSDAESVKFSFTPVSYIADVEPSSTHTAFQQSFYDKKKRGKNRRNKNKHFDIDEISMATFERAQKVSKMK